MAYEDDDDLFGEEFDFVDDDDDQEDGRAVVDDDAKPRKRPAPKDKDKDKAPPKKTVRGRPPGAKRDAEEVAPASELPPPDSFGDEQPFVDEPAAEPPRQTGPPADHVIHIYEYGKFKRTIPRKFTDEEAVGFAEEFTRTGKSYGRYAIATPDDEEPAPTFSQAAKG